jgi:hypothetical protein
MPDKLIDPNIAAGIDTYVAELRAARDAWRKRALTAEAALVKVKSDVTELARRIPTPTYREEQS